MSFDLVALKDEEPPRRGARPRRSLDLETESVVRVLPIRWRLLSIAALNATVAVILAALIWNGANVLSRAWDDVRKVRESDKLLVQLESEASRLQNLIHRYINQPSQEVLTEILGLHGEVLSTLRNRGAVDPVLSGSADELRAVTERFLQGFGEVREVQTTIAQTYENEVLKPAKEMAGLYAIIEGAIGRRDALLLPSLGKSREAFTASLVAANAFYLSLASDAADEARRNITTVEQTIPVMIDLAENSLQRTALTALAQRAAAFREGLKTLSERFATRDQPAEDRDRRQSGRHDRGDQQALRADDAARAAGAGQLRPYPRQHLPERGAGRGHLPDRHRRHRRADRAQHHLAAQGDHGRDAMPSSRRDTTSRYPGRRPATRSARWRARSRSFARTPSPSARPRTSCGPRRSGRRRRSTTCAKRSKTSSPRKSSRRWAASSPAWRTR